MVMWGQLNSSPLWYMHMAKLYEYIIFMSSGVLLFMAPGLTKIRLPIHTGTVFDIIESKKYSIPYNWKYFDARGSPNHY